MTCRCGLVFVTTAVDVAGKNKVLTKFVDAER